MGKDGNSAVPFDTFWQQFDLAPIWTMKSAKFQSVVVERAKLYCDYPDTHGVTFHTNLNAELLALQPL